jgi:hypothetical protein
MMGLRDLMGVSWRREAAVMRTMRLAQLRIRRRKRTARATGIEGHFITRNTHLPACLSPRNYGIEVDGAL